MKKSRFSEEQIIGFIKQTEAGIPIKEICSKGGFSDANFCKWRAKYDGLVCRRRLVAVSYGFNLPASRQIRC